METTAVSVKNTSAECLATYSPKEVAIAFREVRTVDQALDVYKAGNVATLGALTRNIGMQKITALLKLYLIELNEVLGLKYPMTEAQIDQVADEVLARYCYFTMADINLVFRRLKCGECGKLYDRLTMPQLMCIFADYDNERCEISAQRSIAESEYYKSDHARSSDKQKELWNRARKMDFERMFKPGKEATKKKTKK